jgi:virginiamycin B lyase
LLLKASRPDRARWIGSSEIARKHGGRHQQALFRSAAYVYWPTDFSGTIGRSNLDGSAINQDFVVGGGSRTAGVAVDGSHLYWVDYAPAGTIGRSNLDGSEPEPNFITGASSPTGVAVDGSHVYWANNTGGGTIGRADLNGSNVDQNFIAAPTATGVAVDGTYIYWAEISATK